jgi:hypothetical protein
VSKIDNGTKLADRSGNVLKEILISVKKVADISNEIAAASQEQSTGLSQISKAMNELDQSTQSNAATSEEVAASADEMNTQARNLQDLVAAFNQIIHGQSNTARPAAVSPPGGSGYGGRPAKASAPKPLVIVKNKPRKVAAKQRAEDILPLEDGIPEGKLGDISGF